MSTPNTTTINGVDVTALTPATEAQSEAILAAVRTTPEVDITETVRTDKDYSQFAMAIAIAAIAIVAKDNNIE